MKDTVFRGAPSKSIQSGNSSVISRIADFSSFKKTGDYVIAIEVTRPSCPFKIADNIALKGRSGNRLLFYQAPLINKTLNNNAFQNLL
ncbi:MAG: hypothetical protein H7Z13_15770 [Ferruginibacter sp.]|nr:hypothetical protein [Ferruginibacter sp.]